MREAVFSSLGPLVSGARFFDLFAGSGAYGLEAWSRGAAGGIFVEKDRAMAGTLRANVSAVARSLGGSIDAAEICLADVLKWRPAPGDRAGLVFVDPPYAIIEEISPLLFSRFEEWVERSGVVVFEMPGEVEVSFDGWECTRRLGKGRGQPSVCFFCRSS